MRRKRLILFDIDGTLLRTQGAGRRATAAAMLEVFGTASTVDTHHFGGKTDWYTLVELLTPHGYNADSILPHLPAFSEAMGRHMAAMIAQFPATALPGAMDAVQRLRGHDASLLGLVTGNAPSSARVKLAAAGFDPDWFPVGAFGTEAVDRNHLPALAMQRAIDHSACEIVASDVIVIGDTVMDIACARAVGAVAIAVRTGFEEPELLAAAQPDYLLDDLTQLDGIL